MHDNTMHYKGYVGSVEYDGRDKVFHGRVLGISDIVAFEGDSVARLEEDFQNAVDDYLDACREAGKSAETPYSGKITLRVPRQLHAALAVQANGAGKSLNAWAAEILAQATRSEAR